MRCCMGVLNKLKIDIIITNLLSKVKLKIFKGIELLFIKTTINAICNEPKTNVSINPSRNLP